MILPQTTGAEAVRLARPDVLGAAFLDKRNSPYELMLDWFEPYNSVAHSIGVLAVRACDVSEAHKGTKGMSRVLALFPGPRAPKNFAPYLMRTLLAFKQLGEKDCPGILVTERYMKDGLPFEETFYHKAFVTGLLADSPARCAQGRVLAPDGRLVRNVCVSNSGWYWVVVYIQVGI